jgi:hypothetical protein
MTQSCRGFAVAGRRSSGGGWLWRWRSSLCAAHRSIMSFHQLRTRGDRRLAFREGIAANGFGDRIEIRAPTSRIARSISNAFDQSFANPPFFEPDAVCALQRQAGRPSVWPKRCSNRGSCSPGHETSGRSRSTVAALADLLSCSIRVPGRPNRRPPGATETGQPCHPRGRGCAGLR